MLRFAHAQGDSRDKCWLTAGVIYFIAIEKLKMRCLFIDFSGLGESIWKWQELLKIGRMLHLLYAFNSKSLVVTVV